MYIVKAKEGYSLKKNTILWSPTIFTDISCNFLKFLYANARTATTSFIHNSPLISQYVSYETAETLLINQDANNRILTLIHFYYNH
jgi:hypothetical protein